MLPNGAAPNLFLILGGAGAKLEDMAAAYTAFARHGKAGKLRLQPDDPLLERPLMSSGAAWIIRRIWLMKAQPLPDGALPRVAHWHGKRAPAMAIVMPGRLGLTLICHWDLDWQTGRHARCWSVWLCQRRTIVESG